MAIRTRKSTSDVQVRASQGAWGSQIEPVGARASQVAWLGAQVERGCKLVKLPSATSLLIIPTNVQRTDVHWPSMGRP